MFICKNELFFNFEIILELSSLIKQVSEVLHEHLLVLSPFVSCQNVYKADLTNDWTISNRMKVTNVISALLRNFPNNITAIRARTRDLHWPKVDRQKEFSGIAKFH